MLQGRVGARHGPMALPTWGSWHGQHRAAMGPAGVAAVGLTSGEPTCYEIYEMLCNCEKPKDRLS